MNNKIIFSFFMISSFCLCLHAVKNCESKAFSLKDCSSSDPDIRLRGILKSDEPWEMKRQRIASTIKDGADPKVKEYFGYRSGSLKDHGKSALTYAVYNDDYNLALHLLIKGAKVKDDFLWSGEPLFFEAKSEKMIRLLVDRGGQDITGKARTSGDTALHHLARRNEKGSSLLFRCYLEHGLSPCERNSNRQTVLDILMQYKLDDETTNKIVYIFEWLFKFDSDTSDSNKSYEKLKVRLDLFRNEIEEHIEKVRNDVSLASLIEDLDENDKGRLILIENEMEEYIKELGNAVSLASLIKGLDEKNNRLIR